MCIIRNCYTPQDLEALHFRRITHLRLVRVGTALDGFSLVHAFYHWQATISQLDFEDTFQPPFLQVKIPNITALIDANYLLYISFYQDDGSCE